MTSDFGGFNMVLGNSAQQLGVYASEEHPCVSLKLQDVDRPVRYADPPPL